jgi:hypothetical protein
VTKEELDKVNRKAAKLVDKLDLTDRVDGFAEAESFLMIKDHKLDFPRRIKNRLVNPAKSSVGKIGQKIMARLNKVIRERSKLNQWTSTSQAIEWFEKTRPARGQKFFKFDIECFYPAISKGLFMRALEFAERFTDITKDEKELLVHCRVAFLSHKGVTWAKKDGSDFDITIGAWDGAEVAEMVGLYLLDKVTKIIPGAGIYRDDGLAIVKMSGPEMTRKEKELRKIFKDEGLQITTEIGLEETDFLDVVFNLKTRSYRPFRKPNNVPCYVNKNSSHPPSIIRALPDTISRRLTQISSSESEFDKEKKEYDEALEKAGYNERVTFKKEEVKSKKQKRGRKVTFFNPPWASCVSTNISKEFNRIVREHFPRNTLCGRLFNKNTLKVSYSCTKNIKAIISAHNKKVLSEAKGEVGQVRTCNCKQGVGQCPAGGVCMVEGVVYEVTATAPGVETKNYVGAAANSLKSRITSHTKDFKNR